MRNIALIAAAVACTIIGCESDQGSNTGSAVADRSAAVGGSIEKIDTRASFITSQAKALPNIPPKAVIIEQSALIHDDAEEARNTIAKLNDATRLMDGTIRNKDGIIAQRDATIAGMQSDIDALNDSWIGPKTRRLFDRLIAGFFIFGIVSVIFGIISPAGIGMLISRLINANIFAPFVLIRDAINRTRGYKTTVEKTDSVIG